MAMYTVPRSLLNTLPADVLLNILRLCSPEPNREDWSLSFAPGELVKLLQSLPISPATVFDTVTSDREWLSPVCHHPSVCWCWMKAAPPRIAYLGRHPHHFFEVLRSAKRVVLTPSLGSDASIACDFAKHCVSMNSIVVHRIEDYQILHSIIPARGRQLLSLKASFSRQHIADLYATHCPNLRELCIHDLPESDGALERVLPAIGGNLNKLEIHSPYVSDDTMRTIHRWCRALQDVRLSPTSQSDRTAYANLLASYGSQLLRTTVRGFDEIQARVLSQCCPNVQVAVAATPPNAYAVLAHRAINIEQCFAHINEGDFRAAMKTCSSIQSLNMYVFDQQADNVLCRVFDYADVRLQALRSLRIDKKRMVRFEDLCVLSNCTGALIEMELAINSYDFNALDGLKILTAHNSHLSHVKVNLLGLKATHEFRQEPVQADNSFYRGYAYATGEILWFPDDDGERMIIEIIQIFAGCSNLCELVLTTGGRLYWDFLIGVDQLVSSYFRFRRVHIEVLSVLY